MGAGALGVVKKYNYYQVENVSTYVINFGLILK